MTPISKQQFPGSLDDFRLFAAERLREFAPVVVEDAPGMRRAAVLLAVTRSDEGLLSVIVIKRAYRGRNAGQWGLPGGRLDAGETPEEAAVRELHEELGLTATSADLIGRLDDFPAASGFAITPIVAVLDDVTPLRPSPDEVHSVHMVQLSRVAADDTPHWVHPVPQQNPDREEVIALDPDGPGLLQMRLGPKMTIHAPTGAMLWQFREVVLLARDPAVSRVAHFTQPVWTRR